MSQSHRIRGRTTDEKSLSRTFTCMRQGKHWNLILFCNPLLCNERCMTLYCEKNMNKSIRTMCPHTFGHIVHLQVTLPPPSSLTLSRSLLLTLLQFLDSHCPWIEHQLRSCRLYFWSGVALAASRVLIQTLHHTQNHTFTHTSSETDTCMCVFAEGHWRIHPKVMWVILCIRLSLYDFKSIITRGAREVDADRVSQEVNYCSTPLDECWTPSELSKKIFISETKSLFLHALESFLCPVTFVTTAFTSAG